VEPGRADAKAALTTTCVVKADLDPVTCSRAWTVASARSPGLPELDERLVDDVVDALPNLLDGVAKLDELLAAMLMLDEVSQNCSKSTSPLFLISSMNRAKSTTTNRARLDELVEPAVIVTLAGSLELVGQAVPRRRRGDRRRRSSPSLRRTR